MAYAHSNPKLKFAGDPVYPGYYAIAFRKDEAKLVEEVNAALGKLIENGELRRIYEEWHIWNEDQESLSHLDLGDVTADSRRLWTFSRYFPLLLDGAKITLRCTTSSRRRISPHLMSPSIVGSIQSSGLPRSGRHFSEK